MYVRTLIGAHAGAIVEMPQHAAEAAISTGTAHPVDADTLADWIDHQHIPAAPAAVAEAMPPGFIAEIDREIGAGWNLFRANGADAVGGVLNKMPIPNLAAARDLAARIAAGDEEADPGGSLVAIPNDWAILGIAEAMALARHFDQSVLTYAQALAAIEVELARRAQAPQVEPAAANTDTGAVVIPDGWRELALADLRALARNFDPKATTKALAIAAIDAEISRRLATAGDGTQGPTS